MALTNFPYGISSMGNPVLGGGLPATSGKYIFVDATNGADGNDGLSWESAVKTIAQAYSMATTNKDDVIVLSTYAVHTLTTMLDVSKSRVHFIGDVYGRLYGQRARIYMGVTTAATDVFLMKNTGVGNTFTGIKFWDDNTLATYHLGCVGEGGEYGTYRNCEFYASVNLTSDTFAEVVLNGDSAQFYNCTFGSLADAVVGDKIRPAIRMANAVVGAGLVSRDVLIDGCKFWKKAGGTATSFIKIAATADLERGMEIKDCTFISSVLGSTPAVAIASATLTNGYVMLSGSTVAFHCTAIGTATGIISGLSARVAAAIIGIQSTN